MSIGIFIDSFLKRYHDTDYFTKTRARLLMIFLSVTVIIIATFTMFLLFAGFETFFRTFKITGVFVAGLLVCLNLLKKGRYVFAANLFIFLSSMTVGGGFIMHIFIQRELLYSTYSYFIYPCLMLCVIFSDRFFLSITSALFILVSFFVFSTQIRTGDPVYRRTVILALIDSIFSILFMYVISVLVMNIFRKNAEQFRLEADRGSRQNLFIRNTLGENSNKLVKEVDSISGKIINLSENSQQEASAVEEITATVEELSGGIENVSAISKSQSDGQRELKGVLDRLSESVSKMNAIITETIAEAGAVSSRAVEGERSLVSMSSGIVKIGESSREMTEILGIIHDISDQINLLSLNAAIEAARAGDAGRGFAVVADEISKLADKTSSSLKEIERLIRNNDDEIHQRIGEVDRAVSTISAIIAGVNSIDRRVKSIVTYTDEQIAANNKVNESTEELRRRSEQITHATAEQQQAVGEIVNSLSEINNLSQSNSAGAVLMADNARRLSLLVSAFNRTIEDYKE